MDQATGFADLTPPSLYFNFTLNFNLTRHKYPRPIHIIFWFPHWSRGDKKPAMVVLRDEGIYPECHRPDSALSGPRLHAPRPDAARDDGDAGRARLAASRGATAGRPLRGAASLIQPRRRIPRSGGALRHGRQDARARLHVRNKAPLDAAAPACGRLRADGIGSCRRNYY